MKQLLPVFASLVLLSYANSQYNDVGGIRYPAGFNIHSHLTVERSAKPTLDTLRYRTLTTIKEDFVVNSGCGEFGANQSNINVVGNPHGGFLCVWNDERAGDRQVDAQLLDSDGNRVGPAFHVSEGTANWNSEPHVAYNPKSDEYIVLWAGTGFDIQCQRVSAGGEKVGHNFTVNQDYSTNTNNPSAAVDSQGNILVAWFSDVSCCVNTGTYFRILDAQGLPKTDQLPLDPSGMFPNSSIGREDRIASDGLGRCLIVWSTRLDGRSRIVLRTVDPSGGMSTEATVVSDPADTTDHYFPSVTSTQDGHFLILWRGGDGIEGRVYHPDSGFVSAQLMIDSMPNYWYTCGASSDDRSTFFVSWVSDGCYGRRISAQGGFVGPIINLPRPPTASNVSYPRLSKGAAGKLYLVYTGYCRSQTDVFGQICDTLVQPIGAPEKVANDDCSAWQTNPVVCFNRFGESLVVWEDQRNGYHDVYGQVLDASAHPRGGDLSVSDTMLVHWTTSPSVVADRDGNFVVAFFGGEYSRRDLMLQKVSSSGTVIGVNRRITTDARANYTQPRSMLHAAEDGSVLLSWYHTPRDPVQAVRLDGDLVPVHPSRMVFQSGGPQNAYICGLSVNNRSNILVMWLDYDPQTYTFGNVLKAMILDEKGTVVRDTLVVAVNVDGETPVHGLCRLDDEDNMLFIWSSYDQNGGGAWLHVKRMYGAYAYAETDSVSITSSQPRMQIVGFHNRNAFVAWDAAREIRSIVYDDNHHTHTPARLHTFVGLIDVPGDTRKAYSAAVHEDKLLFAWEGSESVERGFDIYASLRRLDSAGYSHFAPLYEHASSVFPNPSTHVAQLWYEISRSTHVTIAVYNVLGQRVADIEDAIWSPGVHSVRFSTAGLSSGTYFILCRGAKLQSRKLIVVK